MVTDHREGFFGKSALIFKDMVQVLQADVSELPQAADECKAYFIMSPAKHDIVQSTTRLVNSILARVQRILWVRVPFESTRQNILVGELAAHGECCKSIKAHIKRVSLTGDLLSPTTAHCPTVVSNMHQSLPRSWTNPATCIQSGFPSLRMASAVWSKCSIWETLVYSICTSISRLSSKRKEAAYIWVGLVYERVEHLHGLPYAHTSTLLSFKLNTDIYVECHRLVFCMGPN